MTQAELKTTLKSCSIHFVTLMELKTLKSCRTLLFLSMTKLKTTIAHISMVTVITNYNLKITNYWFWDLIPNPPQPSAHTHSPTYTHAHEHTFTRTHNAYRPTRMHTQMHIYTHSHLGNHECFQGGNDYMYIVCCRKIYL